MSFFISMMMATRDPNYWRGRPPRWPWWLTLLVAFVGSVVVAVVIALAIIAIAGPPPS